MNWYLGLKGSIPVGWTNEPKEGYIEVSQAVRDIHESHADYIWNGTTLVAPPVYEAPVYVPTVADQIAVLESSITPRMIREALLGKTNIDPRKLKTAKQQIQDIDNQIEILRTQLQ
jgi:hypothetical protein